MTADVRLVGTETAAGIGLLALWLTDVVVDDGTGIVFPLILCLAFFSDDRVTGPDAGGPDERVCGPEAGGLGLVTIVVGNGAAAEGIPGPIPAKGGRKGLNGGKNGFTAGPKPILFNGLNVGLLNAGNG